MQLAAHQGLFSSVHFSACALIVSEMKTKVALFAQGMWKYLNHQMLFPGGAKIQLTETEPERPHHDNAHGRLQKKSRESNFKREENTSKEAKSVFFRTSLEFKASF
jgi:hypothetical protein